jgi:phage FluMu protein Com
MKTVRCINCGHESKVEVANAGGRGKHCPKCKTPMFAEGGKAPIVTVGGHKKHPPK